MEKSDCFFDEISTGVYDFFDRSDRIQKKEGELPSFYMSTLTFDFKTFAFKTDL